MRRSPLLPLLALVLLAGCGGDEQDGGRALTLEAGETLGVVADEYSFDPGRVRVNGGGSLRIELANEGDLAHNLRLFRNDDELGGTPTFGGGETRSDSVRLDRGSYRLVCTVGDHEQLGMTGKLEVR